MSNNYFDADWTARVTVPVMRVGELWEFFCGGDVPVREGSDFLTALRRRADELTPGSSRSSLKK